MLGVRTLARRVGNRSIDSSSQLPSPKQTLGGARPKSVKFHSKSDEHLTIAQPYIIILPLVNVVKDRQECQEHASVALSPIPLRTDLLMIKLRELSKELISNNMPADRYRLQLLAAITALSDNELRALARLIFDNVDL